VTSVIAALLVLALLSGTAFAGRGGSKNGGTTSTGSCTVTPNPVAVGANYTIYGKSLGANRLVNVQIQDVAGTTVFNLATNSLGSVSVTWHSYWTGTSKVTIYDSGGRSLVFLTSCSFQVV
jgi:hypothetical protein